jgi:hypothetical protein
MRMTGINLSNIKIKENLIYLCRKQTEKIKKANKKA